MPQRFVFKKKPGARWERWHIRERGGEKTIGRMYFVSPQDTERFALRLLLLYGKGFTSFEDVRTIDGVLYPSSVGAARAAGYLKDDGYFRSAMQEAVALRMPKQLRSFFVSLIVFADMKPPLRVQLWSEFKEDFVEDYLHSGLSRQAAESVAYHDIVERLTNLGKK